MFGDTGRTPGVGFTLGRTPEFRCILGDVCVWDDYMLIKSGPLCLI